jgi:IS5 family transposase
MLIKEGSIVDASFVAAPRQRNTREQNAQIKEGERPTEFDPNSAIGRQKNCDARWAKKNHEVYYGYKNHAKVDAKSKLVSGYATTPASVHDSQVFEELINEAVFADNAYQSEASCEYLRKRTARTSFSSRQRAVILSAKKNMQPTSYAAVSAFAVNKSSDA